MRKISVVSMAALGAVLIPATALLAQAALAPARTVPLTETVHGITLSDEYRWMEDPANKAEMAAWVSGESLRTRAMLDAQPVRAEFAKLIASTSSSLTRQGGYQRGGGTEMWFRALPGDPTSKLIVRDKAGTRVLIDPAKVTGNPLTTMGAVSLSPDGKTVAVQLSDSGSEVGSVRFFDTATGKENYPSIPRIWGEGAAYFLPGGMITYLQMAEKPIDGDAIKGMTSYIRPLTGGTPIKVMGGNFAGADVGIEEFPIVFDQVASPFVFGVGAGARADSNLFITTRAALLGGKPQWLRVASLPDRVNSFALLGNSLFTIRSKDNSARDLVVQTLNAAGKPGPARVLLRGTEKMILNSVTAARDGLYVAGSQDGALRLLYSPNGKAPLREVKLPFEGTGGVETLGDGNGVMLGLTGWTRNATAYTVRNGKVTPTGIEGSVWDGAKDVVVDRMEAVSADGTRVPLVVTRLKSATGRVPTLIEAYGGYGYDTVTPFYNRNAMAFIAKGGAMAYCGVRGGGERGRAWHEGGRGPNKPRGQEDLIACAETLTAKGIAPAHGPVAMGSSMAGTLVPEAALRKPGAFGAMITRVGVVNATRIAAAENGANQFVEIGNPADPKQFRDLLAMDGYQMIATAPALPPTMMVIGMNDRRVAPWMTAKFVARARAKWPNASIWLRSDDKAGHGVGTTEDVRRDEWSDIFAFTWMNQQAK